MLFYPRLIVENTTEYTATSPGMGHTGRNLVVNSLLATVDRFGQLTDRYPFGHFGH
jgi:hypothetical protein